MQAIPQIEPVTRLQREWRSLFDKLSSGPVVLSNQGRAAAVLVSVDEWNRAAERQFTQEDINALLAAQRAKEAGGPRISHEKLKQIMIERYGADVFES